MFGALVTLILVGQSIEFLSSDDLVVSRDRLLLEGRAVFNFFLCVLSGCLTLSWQRGVCCDQVSFEQRDHDVSSIPMP